MLEKMNNIINNTRIPRVKSAWGQIGHALVRGAGAFWNKTRRKSRQFARFVAGKALSGSFACSPVKKMCAFSLFFGLAVMFVSGVLNFSLNRPIGMQPVQAANAAEAIAQDAAPISPAQDVAAAIYRPQKQEQQPSAKDAAAVSLGSENQEPERSAPDETRPDAAEDFPELENSLKNALFKVHYTNAAAMSLREQERIAAQSGEAYAAEQAAASLINKKPSVKEKSGGKDSAEPQDGTGSSLQKVPAGSKSAVHAEKMPWVQPDNASVASKPGGFVYSDKIPMSYELQAYTYDKCVQRGLEYQLILAIIWRESRFQPDAVNVNRNGTRDSGFMQINDVNKGWLRDLYGINNLMDPYQNIDAGTAMLGTFTNKYGPHYALLAYQYGETGMKRQISRGKTTNQLVELVYRQRDYYRQFI